MSGKNNVEKVSVIDNHVTKQYDILKRLGKGVNLYLYTIY